MGINKEIVPDSVVDMAISRLSSFLKEKGTSEEIINFGEIDPEDPYNVSRMFREIMPLEIMVSTGIKEKL